MAGFSVTTTCNKTYLQIQCCNFILNQNRNIFFFFLSDVFFFTFRWINHLHSNITHYAYDFTS